MRKFKYGCGEVTQNFLLNYSLFKITLNPSKKVEFSSEKQRDMSYDGTQFVILAQQIYWFLNHKCYGKIRQDNVQFFN